ncbi:hypothetical protein D9M73_234290 [compost metagenome]
MRLVRRVAIVIGARLQRLLNTVDDLRGLLRQAGDRDTNRAPGDLTRLVKIDRHEFHAEYLLGALLVVQAGEPDL